jgi:hypothetical protein
MMRLAILMATLMMACLEHGGRGRGGSAHPLSAPVTSRVPGFQRKQVVTAEKTIDSVKIDVTPTGAIAWTLSISNESEDPASIVWDESTFVMPTGEASGRLIRGETRKLDTGNAQPASPLPPRSKVVETVLPEQLIGVEEREALEPDYVTEAQLAPFVARREKRLELLNGGHLYIVVMTSSGKQTWTGIVEPLTANMTTPRKESVDDERPPRKSSTSQGVDDEEPMRK